MKHLPPGIYTLDDPLYHQKNPHQTFLLVCGLYGSLPLLLGKEAGSAALARVLDGPVLLTWGLCLLVGSLFGLVGEFWRGRTYNALVIERTGLLLVGFGALFYAYVVHTRVAGDASYVVGVTSAYGLACVWRCVQITRRLRWLRRLLTKVATMQAQGKGQP